MDVLLEFRNKTRVGGVAMLDVAFTLGVAYVISDTMDWSLWKTTIGVFVVGEGVHLAMGVDTPVTRMMINKTDENEHIHPDHQSFTTLPVSSNDQPREVFV